MNGLDKTNQSHKLKKNCLLLQSIQNFEPHYNNNNYNYNYSIILNLLIILLIVDPNSLPYVYSHRVNSINLLSIDITILLIQSFFGNTHFCTVILAYLDNTQRKGNSEHYE